MPKNKDPWGKRGVIVAVVSLIVAVAAIFLTPLVDRWFKDPHLTVSIDEGWSDGKQCNQDVTITSDGAERAEDVRLAVAEFAARNHQFSANYIPPGDFTPKEDKDSNNGYATLQLGALQPSSSVDVKFSYEGTSPIQLGKFKTFLNKGKAETIPVKAQRRLNFIP